MSEPKNLDVEGAHRLTTAAIDAVGEVVRDQRDAVRLVLAALMAQGHVLVEDVPGVGKTTLARAVARALGCDFSRIQFTSDMLPNDVLGVQVHDPETGGFRFKPGPIFSHLVLADEINRAPPKTQSAMLEAMAERRITVDETTHGLPDIFSVIATQNPVEHHGAYPLPESQLDRFAIRLSLGYPDTASERALLMAGGGPEASLEDLDPVADPDRVRGLQRLAAQVTLSEPVADYILALVQATRDHSEVLLGASPRSSVQFADLARGWALIEGRRFVLPDDVQTLAPYVLAHRLVLGGGSAQRGALEAVVADVVASTAVPR